MSWKNVAMLKEHNYWLERSNMWRRQHLGQQKKAFLEYEIKKLQVWKGEVVEKTKIK